MISILRIAILILLFIAVIDPQITYESPSNNIILIIDDSLSMEQKLNESAWSEIRSQIKKSPPESQLTIIRYAENAVIEIPPASIDSTQVKAFLASPSLTRSQPLKRNGSKLKTALSISHQFLDPQSPSILLLVHDDQQTDIEQSKKTINQLQTQGHLFYEIKLKTSKQILDSWVVNINAPLLAEAQHNIPITVTFSSNHSTTAKLRLFVNDNLHSQQSVQLVSNKLTASQFFIKDCNASSCIIKVELKNSKDMLPINNTRHTVVNIQNSNSILYLHNLPTLPSLGNILRQSGFNISNLKPSGCLTDKKQLSNYNSIIIDDISFNALTSECWTALDQAIRETGLGLLVLGGNHSFGSGNYRLSLLENLLPVTSEASQPTEIGSFIFLLDKSGSMEGSTPHLSPINLAKQAILSSIKLLHSKDLLSLISFDASPQLLIPLQKNTSSIQMIDSKILHHATGGTRLVPALTMAINEFNKSNVKNRVLILISDGHFDPTELPTIEHSLKMHSINVIAIAVGDRAETKDLKRLTSINKGKLLHAKSSIELPNLFRQEMERQRPLIEHGLVTIKQNKTLPFFQNNTWPTMEAYQITKAKQDKFVFLQSTLGDPIIAIHQVGLGKVIAIPSGLGDWTKSWFSWPYHKKFFKNMLDWLNNTLYSQSIYYKLNRNKSDLTILVDAVSKNFDWLKVDSAHVTIASPNGDIKKAKLNQIAAGRFSANIALNHQGLYTFSLHLDDMSSKIQYYYDAHEEFLSTSQGPSKISLINATQINSFNIQNTTSIQALLLLAILISFILLICLQRKIFSNLKALLKQHSNKST